MIINDILQPTHLLLILVVALLVLGPKRLPEATRAIGRGIHDFKSAVGGEVGGIRDIKSEFTSAISGDVRPTPETVARDSPAPGEPHA